MIRGTVSDNGVPLITLELAERVWQAIVDTGFNGYLELPTQLFDLLPREYLGRTLSMLAGGQQIEEDAYEVHIPFDGRVLRAEVTFAAGDQILIGTSLLKDHRLAIDFPAQTLTLERS